MMILGTLGNAALHSATHLAPTVALFLVLLASSVPAHGSQERIVRTFTDEHGLGPGPVWALAQDSTGFLWAGTEAGLFRFDGEEFRRWAPDAAPGAVHGVAVGPNGSVFAASAEGRLLQVRAGGADVIAPPDGPVRDENPGLAVDGAARVWAVTADEVVVHRGSDGRWRRAPPGALRGELPRFVTTSRDGGVYVGTDEGVWYLNGESEPVLQVEVPAPLAVAESREGHLYVLASSRAHPGWRLIQRVDGALTEIPTGEGTPHGRAISLVERHGTLWIAIDRFLVALRPGAPPEVLGRETGIQSGGPLLVDREGSLWLGSFLGLHQLPEPDTRIWAEREGLPSRHVRFIARSGDALWVMTWGGPAFLHRRNGGWTVDTTAWDSRSNFCADADGRVWTTSDEAVLEIRDTAVKAWPGPLPGRLHGCAPDGAGGVWIGTVGELRHVDPTRGSIRLVPLPPGTPEGMAVVAGLQDSLGHLWVATPDRICSAPAVSLLAEPPAREGASELWSCDTVPGAGAPARMVELPDGGLWLSSRHVGVLSRRAAEWVALPMDDLPTRSVFSLVLSPRGGVWVSGHGILERVRPNEHGWDVVERLTRWHGLPATSAGHLVEEEDGSIWIASQRGVVHVPAHARFRPPELPPVALVDARVDDGGLPVGDVVVLPHHRNRIELRFAALSFRDRSLLRHQVRLVPGGQWTEFRGDPEFRWVDLQPGEYRFDYRASVDGESWSTLAAPLVVRVRSPWYSTPWFLGLAAAVLGLLGWLGYRARVAYLLGLERQRTRIAMDLHDEVGSGLASVGILSSVLAGDRLGGSERPAVAREIAREIARVAERLGQSLSDIVWSLDPGVPAMKDLATRLAEHGERLFADDGVSFVVRFPGRWPSQVLPLDVRRNVLLIGLEALHNAARHSRASRVELALLPASGGDWQLQVRDDGVGFGSAEPSHPHAERPAGGRRGLAAMRARARSIGADLVVRSRAGGGTEVRLRFAPGPPRRGRWAGALASLTGVAGSSARAHPPGDGRPHDHAGARSGSARPE